MALYKFRIIIIIINLPRDNCSLPPKEIFRTAAWNAQVWKKVLACKADGKEKQAVLFKISSASHKRGLILLLYDQSTSDGLRRPRRGREKCTSWEWRTKLQRNCKTWIWTTRNCMTTLYYMKKNETSGSWYAQLHTEQIINARHLSKIRAINSYASAWPERQWGM